jgi:hypothetical protein
VWGSFSRIEGKYQVMGAPSISTSTPFASSASAATPYHPALKADTIALLPVLPAKVKDLYDNKLSIVTEAITWLHDFLCSHRENPKSMPIPELIASGAVPRLVELMRQEGDEGLSIKCLDMLINSACRTPVETKTLVDAGVVSGLVRLMSSSASPSVQHKALWALGNISGGRNDLRDVVLEAGTPALLASLLGQQRTEEADLSVLRTAMTAARNMCMWSPAPVVEAVAPLIPIMRDLQQYEDFEVCANAK